MKLIAFDKNKTATGTILSGYADIEIGDSTALNTFEVQGMDDAVKYIAAIDDEYGGIIERSDDGTEYRRTGYTWRGLLSQWLIEPPAGADYYVVSGDINTIVGNIVKGVLGGFFSAETGEIGVKVSNYQFPLHCTVLDGLMGLCEVHNCKLYIRNTIENGALKVIVSARAAVHKILSETAFSATITVSEMGINHLVCWGKGELKERIRKDLYLQPDGSVTYSQYYTGFKERQAVYENSSYESEEKFLNDAIKRLKELASFTKMTITHVTADADVGDFLLAKKGNIVVEQPVIQKILTFQNGTFSEEIKIKGQS